MKNPCGKDLECHGALCSVSTEITQMLGRIKNLSPKNTLLVFPGAAPSRGLFANSSCYFSCWQLWESFYFRGRANSPVSRSFWLPRAHLLPAKTQLKQHCCQTECLQPQRPGLRLKPRSKAYLFSFSSESISIKNWTSEQWSSSLTWKIKWMDGKR